MIVSDIKTRLKRAFGDESGVQMTDEDIIRWINDAQREIVMQNEGLLEKASTADLSIGVQSYTLPADLLILKAIHIKMPGSVSYTNLKGFSFTEFNEYMDGWDGNTGVTGVPIAYTIHAGNIYVFPVPDSNITAGLKIFYQRTPVDVAADGDTPDLPLLYHSAIIKYCLGQAYEMDEDFEAAQVKADQVSSDLATLRSRDDWKVQERYQTITVLADDAW